MLNQFSNSSCRSVFHKIIISLRAERRRREARREKFTREKAGLGLVMMMMKVMIKMMMMKTSQEQFGGLKVLCTMSIVMVEGLYP